MTPPDHMVKDSNLNHNTRAANSDDLKVDHIKDCYATSDPAPLHNPELESLTIDQQLPTLNSKQTYRSLQKKRENKNRRRFKAELRRRREDSELHDPMIQYVDNNGKQIDKRKEGILESLGYFVIDSSIKFSEL